MATEFEAMLERGDITEEQVRRGPFGDIVMVVPAGKAGSVSAEDQMMKNGFILNLLDQAEFKNESEREKVGRAIHWALSELCTPESPFDGNAMLQRLVLIQERTMADIQPQRR